MKGKRPSVAALDLLACLVLVFAILALIAQPKAHPPTIVTPGVVAAVLTWQDDSNNDIDLWARDPSGHIVEYVNRDVGTMNLEHDDMGTRVSGTVHHNERVIVRQAEVGEYVVNVVFFDRGDRGPAVVTVELWRTRGTSAPIVKRTITLNTQGQEETAFRFTLDAAGNVKHVNQLPTSLTGQIGTDTG